MADPLRQSTAPSRNTLIFLCQRLRPVFRYIWRAIVISGVGLPLLTTWLTSKGFSINPTLLEWIHEHWPLVLAGSVLFLILTVVVWYFGRPVASPARALPTPNDRRDLIRRLSDEYHRQQTQSLQEAAMKSSEGQEPTAVTLSSASLVSWRMDVPGKASLASPTPIVQAYDQANAGLLILGKPGVGKSTLLLELALGLLTRAEQDSTQPVPVLVNLSSWALNKPPLPLTTWLEEQLHAMCGIQRHLSHAWIEQNELLLLLDGLDEMEPSARSTCIASINAYREQAQHLVAPVVCSRRDEYLAQEERLPRLDTIEVQQLTPEQVEEYLTRTGQPLAAVQAALQSNAILRELVITPLLLGTVILAYQGKTVEDLPHLGSAEKQQRQVFESYVKRRLEQQAPRWRYASQHIQHWLIWLAEQMKQRQITEFYLEWLQPTWLATKQAQAYYTWLSSMIFGLLFGLLMGLLGGLLGGLVLGLVIGLGIGLTSGLTTAALLGDRVEAREHSSLLSLAQC
jgi:GTPase SAR1 family protein